VKNEALPQDSGATEHLLNATKIILAGVVLAGCTEAGPVATVEPTPTAAPTSAPATTPGPKPRSLDSQCVTMIRVDKAAASIGECLTLDKLNTDEVVEDKPPFRYQHSPCAESGGTPIGYADGTKRSLGTLPAAERAAIDGMLNDPVVNRLLQHAEGGFVVFADASISDMGATYVDNKDFGNDPKTDPDMVEVCISSRYDPMFSTVLHYRTMALHEGGHAWLADVIDMAKRPGNAELAEQLQNLTEVCLQDMRAFAREYGEEHADAILQNYKDLRAYFRTQNAPAISRVIDDVIRTLQQPRGFERLAITKDEKSGCELVLPLNFMYNAAEKRGYSKEMLEKIWGMSEYYPDSSEHGYLDLIEHNEHLRGFMIDTYAPVTESSVFRGYDNLGHAGDGLHETVASRINITQVSPMVVIRNINALSADRRELEIRKMEAIIELFRLTMPDILPDLKMVWVVEELRKPSPATIPSSIPSNNPTYLVVDGRWELAA
jgi:hypothetical protein